MIKRTDRKVNRLKRHQRVRVNVSGTKERPRLAVYRSGKIPLVASPGKISRNFDDRVGAIHAYLLHARALLLVHGQIILPADDGRRIGAVHHGNFFGIVLVELFDIADLPGAEHF